MLINHNNHPLKQIPFKYVVIKNITDYLEDEHQRRLTEVERKSLDTALFLNTFDQLISLIKQKDAELYEKVKDSSPLYAVKVKVHGQSTSYIVRTNNNISLKCMKSLYDKCPFKRNNATQLTFEFKQ